MSTTEKENIIEATQVEQESTTAQGVVKLLDSEIKLLQELQEKKQAVINELGFLAQQQILLDMRQEEVEDAFKSNSELEKQIGKQLSEKYGNGTLNLQDGVFIPS